MDTMFEGLKVIDCATYIAAPAAATLLADLGADVIKIERPGFGDPFRNEHPTLGTFDTTLSEGATVEDLVRKRPTSPSWLMDSRSKKSLALDLTSEAGHEILQNLVSRADVFITNFLPEGRVRLKISYEHLQHLNPRLIYASFTGFGESGPEANNQGFDAGAWWARSGIMDLVRTGTNPPTRNPPGVGDHGCSVALFGVIAAALYRREISGKGSHVGSSLLMNGYWANSQSIQGTLCGETITRQPDRQHSRIPLRNCYQCSDDRWLLLSIVPDQKRWENLRAALRSEILDNPIFQTVKSRAEHSTSVTAALDTIFYQKPLAEWTSILSEYDVAFGPVVEMQDIGLDDQVKASGILVPFADSELTTVTSPFWIAGYSKPHPRTAPSVGQHTDSILKDYGYDDRQIKELRASGVVG